MAWLKIDDGFTQHPKIVALTRGDRWTWLEVLTYCARYRTGGHVPSAIAEVVRGATPAFLERCFELRLLDPSATGDDGYEVHDWVIHNGGSITEKVQRYLEYHPDASANEVHREVGGSRALVLAEVARIQGNAGTDAGTKPGTETGTSRARVRARPVPSLSTTSSSTRPHAPEALAAAAETAAAARHQLEALGIDPGLAEISPSLALEWIHVARTEARTNPAGFVVAGIRSGIRPSTRTDTGGTDTPPLDPAARRRRWIEDYGWRMDPDLAAPQLEDMGADLDERIGLLEYAADLRAQHHVT